jgi:alpha-mannosidase
VTTIENSALDHRLRVLFPTPFAAETAAAEGVFEVANRPARLPQPSAEEAPDWAELPVDTHPHKRFVDVSDGERGLAVLNRGLPEYELVPAAAAEGIGPGSTVALTLLRCVDWLSREDLATRRGHAGPMLHTPEAQGLGKHVFEYALVPHVGDWQAEEALVPREAAAFESPMRTRVTEQHEGALRDMWSFVHVAPAGVAVSSVKKAEREDALVVRLYNPTGTALGTEVILAKPFREVVRVNLNEDALPNTAGSDLARILSTGVRTHLRAGEIQTLLFRLV